MLGIPTNWQGLPFVGGLRLESPRLGAGVGLAAWLWIAVATVGVAAQSPQPPDPTGGAGDSGGNPSAAGGPDGQISPDVPAIPGSPSGGAAQNAGRAPRVAVLLLAAGGVEPATADSLTELAIGLVAARGGVTIVGKEELQAQLGQGEARSIECVSSTACLGRVGVELGVDEVIAGTIGRRSGRWVFNINRIDITSGALAGRAFREVPGDVGALADSIQAAVPELYSRPTATATLWVSATVAGAEISLDGQVMGTFHGEPLRAEGLAPGPHAITARARGYREWTRTVNLRSGATVQLEAAPQPETSEGGTSISPLVWIGTGLAVAATATGTYFGLSSQNRPAANSQRRDALAFVEARQQDATIANVGFAVAGAGVLTAVLGLLLSDFGAETTTVGVRPLSGGGLSLAAEGHF